MSPEEEIQNYRCVIDDLMNQIERMKRSGRRKRDECRKLKKQASLMQFVSKKEEKND